jgi:hypothetical protein
MHKLVNGIKVDLTAEEIAQRQARGNCLEQWCI